jgi:hypothetical protein
MDLQTRKIMFIQDFLKLESEKAISHLENLLQKEKKNDSAFQIMTIQEFQQRIDKSLDDSRNGRLTEANELLSQIGKWS